jgi:hypothetical protein
MKIDVLTIAAVVFTLGVLASAFDFSEAFAEEPQLPSALHQGLSQR